MVNYIIGGKEMKNFKKVFSLLLVYFFVVTVIPTGLISKIVNAEESVPKFLDYTEGYAMDKLIYKDNSLATIDFSDREVSLTYIKDNKAKKLDGYISDYLGGSKYVLDKEDEKGSHLYVYDLEKGETVGDYSCEEQKNATKNKYGNNAKIDVYHIYGDRWYQYYGDYKSEYVHGLVSPSNKVIEYGSEYSLQNSATDKSGDNIYGLFTKYGSVDEYIKIINKDGSIKEYTINDNPRETNYNILRLYVQNNSLCALVENSKHEVTVSKFNFENNTAKLGEVLFSRTKNDFTQDSNGDFWTVEDGFVKKFVDSKWVNKYQVDKKLDSIAVYDDNNIFLSGYFYNENKKDNIGIYKIINIASAPETKPETPASGNGQGGSATGNSSTPTTTPGSTTGASGSTSSTTTTATGTTAPTTATSSTTQNTATASATNKTVVGTAKDGVLPVAVNKLDKDAANVVDVTTATTGNKVEVTIADTKAIKEGNGSLQVKAGQNELVNLPFSVVDKSLITDSSKLVLDTTVADNTDIVKGLKAVKKLYSFDLTLVDGDKRTAIHKFANGSAEITINLSDEELKGLDKNNLAVFYYNEDTKKFELMDTKVDGNKVTFKTPHFSKFIIAEKSSNSSNSAQVLPKTGSTFGTMSLVILGAVLVLFGFAITRFKRVAKSN
jgi:LPXTG-motif cell wall-anchored protein